MLICDTLEDFNFEIDEAEDGLDAINKIQTNNYDLILLDYMMPHYTGIEVISIIPEAIKEKTPIVMLTAKAQESDRQIALEYGASYFISKPFSPVELMTFVEELLNE